MAVSALGPVRHNAKAGSDFPFITDFSFADFLKTQHRFGLDPNRPYCKAWREGHCPLAKQCPEKHPTPESYNVYVCKHWLRGLCKLEFTHRCSYLHEYNLHGMPECPQYERTMNCKTGPDCLFLHIDPTTKVPSCPHYEKGFCPLGPRCGKKHLRRTICKFYLAGFCPYGRQCQEGVHPRWPEDLPKPTPPIPMTEEEKEAIWQKYREAAEREEEQERERNRRSGRGGRGRYTQRRRGGYDR